MKSKFSSIEEKAMYTANILNIEIYTTSSLRIRVADGKISKKLTGLISIEHNKDLLVNSTFDVVTSYLCRLHQEVLNILSFLDAMNVCYQDNDLALEALEGTVLSKGNKKRYIKYIYGNDNFTGTLF